MRQHTSASPPSMPTAPSPAFRACTFVRQYLHVCTSKASKVSTSSATRSSSTLISPDPSSSMSWKNCKKKNLFDFENFLFIVAVFTSKKIIIGFVS